MQFRRTGPNFITSDAGFSVEVLGRTGLRYREGFRRLFVDSEILATPHGIAVFSRSIRRRGFPFSMFRISSDRRTRILENIRAAFHSQGVTVEIS
jgi:hypothetical protein